METFIGILIPFIGTTLGSACVFFMKKSLSNMVQRSLAGFAAGVMVAASIWSLLIPADSCYRAIRKHGKAVLPPCVYRLLDWNIVFAPA